MFLSASGSEPHNLQPLSHWTHVYSTLIPYREVGEGGELNQREGYRDNSSQSWVENTNMTDCISSL